MKTRIIPALLIAVLFSYPSDAQTRKKAGHTTKKESPARPAVKAIAPEDKRPINTFKDPVWAPKGYHSQHHVYFPDYETFYDPRRGYIVKDKNSWVASPSMPLFLSNKDLAKERVMILEDLSLDLRPEESYPRY